ncbi:hypothetical protein [Streptomyces beigongshangae]|uniref:hypothetical protein n=1 Tax=Streptomyces beigongshangae TaxID=2841597 RepID=UPI001C8591F9|nr:hypothetical protein [Streptomyces sp. REN17]
MYSTEFLTDQSIDIQEVEAALDPIEADGSYRDSRQCAALALLDAKTQLLLSPPTPRPKKG